MCGRYSLTSPEEAMRHLFGMSAADWMQPRYNITPSQIAPVVRRADKGDGIVLDGMTWGLIPSWSKEAPKGGGQINARSETAAEKPMFRAAYRRRRCLVPSDGFYEWRKVAGGKQPYWISRADGAPFVFAGLWETWGDSHGTQVVSFAILTTQAAADIEYIHHRMPVILGQSEFDTWLDPDASPQPDLFVPEHAPQFAARPVSRRVNSPRNDDAECLVEVPDSSDQAPPKQGSLF